MALSRASAAAQTRAANQSEHVHSCGPEGAVESVMRAEAFALLPVCLFVRSSKGFIRFLGARQCSTVQCSARPCVGSTAQRTFGYMISRPTVFAVQAPCPLILLPPNRKHALQAQNMLQGAAVRNSHKAMRPLGLYFMMKCCRYRLEMKQGDTQVGNAFIAL